MWLQVTLDVTLTDKSDKLMEDVTTAHHTPEPRATIYVLLMYAMESNTSLPKERVLYVDQVKLSELTEEDVNNLHYNVHLTDKSYLQMEEHVPTAHHTPELRATTNVLLMFVMHPNTLLPKEHVHHE